MNGIYIANEEEISDLWWLIEKASGKDLDLLYKWMTERSDSGNAATPGFVIARMKDKLFR